MLTASPDKPAPSRLKFWVVHIATAIVGGFVTAVLIGIATLAMRDAGLIDPDTQPDLYAIVAFAAWIVWLVWLVLPLFTRRRRTPSS